MKNEIPCLDLLVRKLSTDPRPHVHSAPPNGHSPPHGVSPQYEIPAPPDRPIPNCAADVEDTIVVPDAEFFPNEVGNCSGIGAQCCTDDVITAPQ